MINLSNDCSLEFLVASGALAFDGRGYPWERLRLWNNKLDPSVFDAIVLKTLTYKPREGNWRWYNSHQVVKWLHNKQAEVIGHVNSIGLTNPGFDAWFKNIAPRLNPKWNFIVSIASADAAELIAMGQKLNSLPLVAVEFNSSCPNSPSERSLLDNTEEVVFLARRLKQATKHPLIIKVSYQQNYLEIVDLLEDYVEAVAINSVPWNIVYPGQKSPLPKKFGQGGVSGLAAQPFTWEMVRKISRQGVVPVIGTSVWSYADLAKLKSIGARAVAFGSVFIKTLFSSNLPNEYAHKWQKEHGIF
ncbi:MAG: hypothetical protein HY973_04300 [Candidatus Kerfeldbacteria bacterium]|nr:hypothetical protein [Candidatus Kerfeldbacteria bacterium]